MGCLNDCAWDNGTGRLRPFIGLSGDVMIDRNGRRDSYERVKGEIFRSFSRTIYAGNAIQKVQSSDATKVITVRGTAFDDAATADNAEFVGQEIVKSDRPSLAAASVVISGGRGMKNGDNFQMLYDMADKCGAAVGASRAA